MNYRRLLIGVLTGAVLGVFCILGAAVRFDHTLAPLYLFSFWLNRVIIGLVIGLLVPVKGHLYLVFRDVAIGLLISFTFYSATDFLDATGFIAGGVYGIIIEYTTHYFGKSKNEFS